MRDAEKDNPGGTGELSRRELLRRGLLAGAGAAAFGAALSSQKVETAAAGSAASVFVELASQWPWGAAVDSTQPFYLSPDPDASPEGSKLSAISIGPRTGLAAPLLVVPLTVTV